MLRIAKYFLIQLILVFTFSPLYSANNSLDVNESVLIVHSYHKGFTWTDNVDKGIQSAIPNLNGFKGKEIFIEYLDAKRNHDPDYIQKILDVWRVKFCSVKIPVIITSDDIAFQVITNCKELLFPESFIVFCGVNNLADYQIILSNNKQKITGVVENIDIENTIKAGLNLHKNTQHVFIINDDTPTGKANRNAFLHLVNKLPNHVSYEFIPSFPMTETREVLEKLPLNSMLLLLSYNKDSKENYFNYEETGRIICSNTNLPVYVVWDFYLGTGAIGGMLVSGIDQGKIAAGLANQLLIGTPINLLPIIGKSPNRYIYDYDPLMKAGIKLSLLPQDATVIGKPVTIFEKFKKEIIILSITFMILLGAILALLFFYQKKAKAEQGLVISKNKLLTILETAKEGFFEINNFGIITYINKELCLILESEKEAIENHSYEEFLALNVHKSGNNEFKKAFTGSFVSFEMKIDTRHGNTKDLVVNVSPLFASNGFELESIFGFVSDITYLKEKENELILARERAVRSDNLKSAFLANMSHEIRTPMNAILGFTDLLTEIEIPHDQRAYYIDIIKRSGFSLLTIINDILDLSKIEAGEISIINKPLEINNFLESIWVAFKEYRKTIQKESIKIELECLPKSLIINTDEFRLNQVLSNLLNNAFKFTEAGKIIFGCNQVAVDELMFYVKDSGIGMPANMQELVFERFHKIENSKNQFYRGAGLGLAISKNLVELLGGNIFCESEEGKGTIFYFTIKGLITKAKN